MDRFIDITQLSKSFGQQKVLDNIDFQLKKSEIIGLIGPSGFIFDGFRALMLSNNNEASWASAFSAAGFK